MGKYSCKDYVSTKDYSKYRNQFVFEDFSDIFVLIDILNIQTIQKPSFILLAFDFLMVRTRLISLCNVIKTKNILYES